MTRQIDPDTLPYAALELARLCRVAFEQLVSAAELGITPGEARVLASVARHGPLRQTGLAYLTGLGPMAITGYLDRLERSGLVERTPDPEDRRAKLVCVTDTADAMLTALRVIGDEVRATIRKDFSDADWVLFLDLLKRARINLGTFNCAGSKGSDPE